MFSEPGTPEYMKEQATYISFRNLLEEIEGNQDDVHETTAIKVAHHSSFHLCQQVQAGQEFVVCLLV